MSRNTAFQFVSADSSKILTDLVSYYEASTNRSLQPGDPDRLFAAWLADIIVHERVLQNYNANRNIPSRAEGQDLDTLGSLFYGVTRPEAAPAFCTVKFTISQAQTTSIIVPKGTRVTDSGNTLVWATTDETLVPPGEVSVQQTVQCETPGDKGNGYLPGQINTLVDIGNIRYFSSCSNVTESSGGAETADDETYYQLMKAALNAFNTAGSKGAYEYFAKSVSTHILDVAAISPQAACVDIYAVMDDGTPADTEIKNAILAECNSDSRRPLTDLVSVKDPQTVPYDIDVTFYLDRSAEVPAADVETAVSDAVNDYIKWQYGKIGRDINPSKLIWLLSSTGIKRVAVTKPEYTVLNRGTSDGSTPQIAKNTSVSIINGGYEDE